MIKKFESYKNLISFSDNEVTNLTELVEDCMIDCKVHISPSLITDFLDDDTNSKFTSSIGFNIEHLVTLSNSTYGNPYSNNDIDISTIFSNYRKSNEYYANEYKKFIDSIKSLFYRIEKSRYKICYLSLSNNSVIINFCVEDEKVVRV